MVGVGWRGSEAGCGGFGSEVQLLLRFSVVNFV
jgi:hypothetical protein